MEYVYNEAGWDSSTSLPSSAYGIHHPGGDYKKISFGGNLNIGGYGGVSIPSRSHFRPVGYACKRCSPFSTELYIPNDTLRRPTTKSASSGTLASRLAGHPALLCSAARLTASSASSVAEAPTAQRRTRETTMGDWRSPMSTA